MSINRDELENYLNSLLKIENFKDYGPNGLQIEGKEEINKLAFAVSATRESIEKSIELGADALIVHHGLFWVFHGPKTITKAFANRVKPLIQKDISLFGYHLPLDANPEVGNATGLAHRIGLSQLEPFGDYKGSPTGVKGMFNPEIEAKEIKEKLEKILNHNVLWSEAKTKNIMTVGIITGGANGGWAQAFEQGLDAYITGEMSEHDWHEAKECGIHMFAGGHHATERFGVKDLMQKIQKEFSIESHFIDSSNPA